jgi:hypothetical protein
MTKLQNTYHCPNKAVHTVNSILDSISKISNKTNVKHGIFLKILQQKNENYQSDVTSSEDDIATTADDVMTTNSDVSDTATPKRCQRQTSKPQTGFVSDSPSGHQGASN